MSKSLEKFRKSLESLEKRSENVRKKLGKSSEKVQKFWKLGITELSENYEKMTFNSKFENHEKLVPTQKPTRKFGKKFGMLGLTLVLLFDPIIFFLLCRHLWTNPFVLIPTP